MKVKFIGLISFICLVLTLSSCEINFSSFFNDSVQKEEPIEPEPSNPDEPIVEPSNPIEPLEPIIDPVEPDDKDGIPFYGYLDLERYEKKEAYKAFYNDILKAENKFLNSKDDINPTPITNGGETKNYYVIEDVSFKSYDISINEAQAIYRILNFDHPEFYFISNSIVTTSKKDLRIIIDDIYAKNSLRQSIASKLLEFESGLNLDGMSDYNKIKTIHDYIILKSSYALDSSSSPETAVWAHNYTGIVLYGKGVCEAYSELFSLLCRHNNLYPITVTGIGKANGSQDNHEWNYVMLEDKWYGMDVTWDDTAMTNDYFLCGSDVLDLDHGPFLSYDLYTSGINYVYALPELSHSKYVSQD